MAEKRKTLWSWLKWPRPRAPIRTRRVRFRPWLEQLETRDVPSTVLVVNTLDSGPGSLRDAIDAANQTVPGETVEILFQISATDPGFLDVDAAFPGGDPDADAFVIAPLNALPALTRGNVFINGASQQTLTGDSNPFGPEMVLAGHLADGDVNGLVLASSANRVHALNIQQFGGDGVLIAGDDNTLTGNYIGTKADGLAALGNGGGVFISGGANNMIGGTVPGAGNLISGNNASGVRVSGVGASGNLIQGNYIGVNAAGSDYSVGRAGWWKGEGDYSDSVSSNAGTPHGGVSFSTGMVGQAVRFDGSTGYVDLGNDASLDIAGSMTLSLWLNAESLKHLQYLVADFDVSGDVSQGSLGIFAGRFYWYQSTSDDDIVGGTAVTPGQWYHVAVVRDDVAKTVELYVNGLLDGAMSYTGSPPPLQRTKLLGRSGPEFGDHFHGALDEVTLWDRPLAATEVGAIVAAGNAGIGSIGNAGDGVRIENGASNNTIGGTSPAARNVISGNTGTGIAIDGGSSHLIQGNYIGTTADGTTVLGNADGISIGNSTNNLIGGPAPTERNIVAWNTGNGIRLNGGTANTIQNNLVSGNARYGVLLNGSPGNDVIDNLIGTNPAGNGALPNSIGLSIQDAGANTVERNTISGNSEHGVYLSGPTSGNLFFRNHIGVGADGITAVPNGTGVLFAGTPENTLLENVISANNGAGVAISGSGNILRGNYIGTTADGLSALGNIDGIVIEVSGGSTPGGINNVIHGNVISANDFNGIYIAPAPGFSHVPAGNIITGNLIGTDKTGMAGLGNGLDGIVIKTVIDNRIGGLTSAERNVIADNFRFGIQLEVTAGNLVQGNYIGVAVDGVTGLGNTFGVGLVNDFASVIGGSEPGAGNVISANAIGITMYGGLGTINARVEGNRIGTTANGTAALGNDVGVSLDSSGGNKVINVTIGGSDPGAGNLISGNRNEGILVRGADAQSIVIQGNKIGIDIDGLSRLPNTTGVMLVDVSGALVGGATPGARNVISGNHITGVGITGAGATGNVVQGNYIGVDSGATFALRNGLVGAAIDNGATGNLIGGDDDDDGALDGVVQARNVIAGHDDPAGADVSISGDATTNNRVQGNYLGVNAAGNTALAPNARFGVSLNAPGNLIGGGTPGAGNVISGHGRSGNAAGIVLYGPADGTTIQGNRIGTDASGTQALFNTFGIWAFPTSDGHTIGTDADGANDAAEGNLISGNSVGLTISGSGNAIAGNRIGVNAAGSSALPNLLKGIELARGDNNTIGGPQPVQRNLISGNLQAGISLHAGINIYTSVGSTIQGNYIGTDVTGMLALPNSATQPEGGIVVGSANNVIRDNLISGNAGVAGLLIGGPSATGNIVQGNYIGTDATGRFAVPNTGGGVFVGQGAAGNIIGTDADGSHDASEGNVISGNAAGGVILSGPGTTNNVVAGNYVGTDALGRAPIGGAISWYAAEGDAGDVVGGLHGTVSGNVTFTPGKVGQAFNFDGGDGSRVLVANNAALEPAAAVTVEAWVRSSDVGLVNYILAKGANGAVSASYALYSGAQGGLQFYVTIDGIFHLSPDAGAGIWDGDWHHVAGTYDGSSVRLFVDGLEIGNGTAATGSISYALPTSNDLSIGHYPIPGANGAGFDGSIDEIAVYDRALSTAEIQFIHAQGTTGKSDQLGNAGDGVRIANGASNNTIGGTSDEAGNVISNNAGDGVHLLNANSNLVQGNTIGLSASGEPLGNSHGVSVVGGADNTIGGGAVGAGNVIAGGTDIGVVIHSTTGTRLQGNWIGTDRDLAEGKGNRSYGVAVFGAATANYIGTDGDGASDADESNVIAQNGSYQVIIHNPGTDNNVVAGNFIGTDPTGTRALGGSVGVYVFNGARGNRIGTNSDGISDEPERNLISGNASGGVAIHLSDDNLVAGNYIGTDATGSSATPNASGIVLQDASNNVIGGSQPGAGNVVSGNAGAGITIFSSGGQSTANTVHGNTIGLAADGVTPLGNGSGVVITDSADNLIGGPTEAARNVISTSTVSYGVIIQGFGATGNFVEGNYIGTDASGTLDRGNHFAGVLLSDTRQNTLRGNVISGNGDAGVFLIGSTPQTDITNLIEDNFIGADGSGTAGLGNTLTGVRVFQGFGPVIRGNLVSGNDNTNILVDANASGVLIEDNRIGADWTGNARLSNPPASGGGVTLVGPNNVVRDNVISANPGDGVIIDGQDAGDTRGTGNVVAGNLIGLALNGVTPLGNARYGVLLWRGASDNTIGGVHPGDGNVIAASGSTGIYLEDLETTGNAILGNLIGTDKTGTASLGNVDGIAISNASGNRIGGPADGERNIISGNTRYGVHLSSLAGNTVQGNYVGTDITGTTTQGVNNAHNFFLNGDTGSLIGGPGPGEGNVIAGGGWGIWLGGTAANRHTTGTRIQGNKIGTNAAGTQARGNAWGIYVEGQDGHEVHDLTIGGAGAGAGNLISGNILQGITVRGAGVHDLRIEGNFIGTNSTGDAAVGNGNSGILLDHASGVLIGGSTAARNIISGNFTDGIRVVGPAETVRHQSFNDAQSAAAQGWSGFGNDINRQNFGFSPTNHTGFDTMTQGEAGGVFVRGSLPLGETTDPAAYYADTELGPILSLDHSMHASGEWTALDFDDYDASVEIGFFGRASAEASLTRNLLGLRMAEPSPRQGVIGFRPFAWIVLADGTQIFGQPIINAPIGLDVNTPYTWRFDYDPEGGADGHGVLTCEVFLADGTSLGISTIELTAAQRAIGIDLDAFGLHTGGFFARSNNPNTAEMYIDNVSYGWTIPNRIEGNFIGTDVTGTQVLRNFTGIHLDNSTDVLIGGTAPGAGNVIAGNTGNIRIVGPNAARNQVQGNLIGLDVTGTMAVTNGFLTGTNDNGITIESGAHYNLIGGSTAAAGNVISGHWGGGIGVTGGSSRNLIQGNRVGTNADGTAAVGNGAGVAFGDGEDNQVIGNLVSGNNTGIGIFGINVTNQVVVQGNLIGTDVTGTLAVPNLFFGIRILNAPGAHIGGTDAAERNVISGNSSYGIVIWGARDTIVEGNFIGTDINGTQALGNQTGIWITDHADDNVIGGAVAGARNLISGNVAGVNIDGFSNNNRVQGNYIGTDVTGAVAITAGTGVTVGGGAAQSFIGTDGDGINDALEGNLISGNDSGVFIWAGARDNVVAGNLIGTDPTGRTSVRNGHGVTMLLAGNNRIGSNADEVSDDLERNVISGNSGGGVLVLAVPDRTDGTNDNVIAGNYIGVDSTGLETLGNGSHGVSVRFSHLGDFLAPPTGTIIGGALPAQRNIIAGNGGYGIFLDRAADTVIQGNYVGTEVTGTRAFPNAHGQPGGPPNGILVASSTGTLIGGGTPGAGNLISGNVGYGVAIWYEGSENTRVQGNLIGTDATGTFAVANTGGGVSSGVGARLTIIGTDGDGTNDAFEGNVISGNQNNPDVLTWGVGVGNQDIVAGNKIGTDITGTQAIPNATGVLVGGFGSRIGTNADGVSDELEGNLISGNLFAGVGFGGGAANHVLAGNVIGLDPNGAPLGNGAGIDIHDARDILIGTNADGLRDDLERNVISGNNGVGVWIRGAGADVNTTGNVIAGNYIGVGLDGLTDRGNAGHGLWLSHGSHDALIGGAHPSARNVIAGNDGMGVRIDDSNDHRVLGNFIGVDRTGLASSPNDQGGVHVFSYYYNGVAGQVTTGNRIGGAGPGEGNVISGNAEFGIFIQGDYAADNSALGNFIGLDASGTRALGNDGPGVRVEAPGNRIGGPTLAAGNVISGNAGDGIHLNTTTAADNIVQSNLIGTDAAGTTTLGNQGAGLHMQDALHNHLEANVIAGNQHGVALTLNAHDNVLLGNFVGTDRAGTGKLGNIGHGVLVTDVAANNTVGTIEQPNVIAFNRQAGVATAGAGVGPNPLRGNAIFDNGGLGIDRGANGVTLVGLPELQLVAGGHQTFVEGRLQADPDTTYTLDFYASSQVDPSLYGEGQRYLGSAQVSTGPDGAVAFQALLPLGASFGEFVAATATDPAGNTSEFSLSVAVAVDANEPNNATTEATELGSLDDNNGRIEPRALIAPTDDRDFYRLDVPVERSVEIQTFADREGSLLDTILTLSDEAGNVLAVNDDFVGQDSIIRARLQPGTYVIEVSGFQGSVGPYRLVLIDRDFVGPQVLRLTPSKPVTPVLSHLQLWFDSNDLDPATVTADAFVLERLDAAGQVQQNHSAAVVERIYEAQLDRVTLRLGETLPDGVYRLTVRDSLHNLDGLPLDGDRQGGPGGDFIGGFAIDGTAPSGTVQQAGVAGQDTLGVRYRFAGSVSDAHPAAAGEIVVIELDVDNDGFDDGRAQVALLGSVQTPFIVTAATGIAAGQSIVPIRVRFVDGRGNASNPQVAAVDTNLPVVTSVRPGGSTLQVTFNLDVDGADQAGSYAVAGQTIADVQYSPATRTAQLSLAGGLPDGTYALSVLAGQGGIQRNGLALDGDGDGRAGGTFTATVLVDRVAPVVGAVQLAAASDSGLAGDGRTNQVLVAFDVTVSDVFPTATSEITVLVDVDGDGFDDGLTRAILVGSAPAQVAVAAVTPIAVQGAVPVRIRVVDAAGNTAESSTSVVIDRDGPRLLSSSRAEVWRDPAGAILGIRYVLEFDKDLDAQAAQAMESYALFRAGGDQLFYDGDDVHESARIASITYRPSDEAAAAPARVEVLAPLRGGADNDDYELTAFAGRVVDVAANPLIGGDARLRVRFEILPPVVESAFLLSPVLGEAPTQVLVQFRDVLGLRDASGRFLKGGDHVIAVQLGNDGGALAIAEQQPGANPDGPALQQAVLGGGRAPRLMLSFDQPLDGAEAVRASNYVIVGAGPDGRLRTPDDDLTVLPSSAVAVAPDGRTVTLDMEGLDVGRYLVRIDGTGGAELDEQAAGNRDNYRLDRLGADSQTLSVGSLHFNSFGDRVILSDFGSLAPGVYRLVVFTGIANSSGAVLDGDFDGHGGDSYVQIFNVQAEAAPAQLTLNPDAFERNHAALEAFALQTQEDVVTSAKALAEADFAARLLTEVEIITAVGPAGSSAEIADAIQDAVRQAFETRLAELPILPNEYVIVWSHNARFLLADAADPERQIGFRLDGAPIDDRLPGGVVLGSAFAEETGLPGLSLAIVPIDPVSHFFIGPPAVDLSGNALLPTLGFTMELEGLDAANQVGLLFYGMGGLVDQATFTDVPAGVEHKEVTSESGITGFDPAIFIIDAQVQAEADAVLRPRGRRSYLILWVDPVDFALLDPQLRRAGAVGGQNFLSIPGAFFSGNGFTELIVIANPVAATYRLDLFGLGADFRGALHVLTSDFQANVPFQGRLATGAQAAAVIDVLGGARPNPEFVGPAPVFTPPAVEVVVNLTQQLTASPNIALTQFTPPETTTRQTAARLAGAADDTRDTAPAAGGANDVLTDYKPTAGVSIPENEIVPPPSPPERWRQIVQFLSAVWRYLMPLGPELQRLMDFLQPADGNADQVGDGPDCDPGADSIPSAPPTDGPVLPAPSPHALACQVTPADPSTSEASIDEVDGLEDTSAERGSIAPISLLAGALVFVITPLPPRQALRCVVKILRDVRGVSS